MKRQEDEEDLLTLAAAYLCSAGQRQWDIARHLGVSQPAVSRLLKRADEKKWLKKVPPRFEGRKLAKKLWQRARTRFFSSAGLLEKLRELRPEKPPRLRHVYIIPSYRDGNFGRTAARVIEELLPSASLVGVTWGRALSNLVGALWEYLPRPLRKARAEPIQFIPLCGEPLRDRGDPLKYSSSALAADLNELINGKGSPIPPSLAGVPAFIPAKFSDAESATILKFMSQVAGYGTVFGDAEESQEADALVDQVDTILTSVGVALAQPRGIFLTERVALGDLSEQELRNAVIGDIGGIIIAKEDLAGELAERIKTLNDRWTGIKQRHLRRCARDALKLKRPGVIVLGMGKHRAPMVRRCVELGLINELIIDQELAKELTASRVR